MADFLQFLLVPLVAALVTYGYDYFSKAVSLLDKIPSVLRPVVIAAASFGAMKLTALIGITLGADPTVWTATDLEALVSALLSYVFKLGKNQKELRSA